jgi:hypothetical protein
MSSPPVIPVIARERGRGPGSALRIGLLVLLVLGLAAGLLGGALFAVRAYWPHVRVAAGAPALARVTLAPLGEHVSSVRVLTANGRRIGVRLGANRLEPLSTIGASERLRVTVTVKRSGWLGWLVGATEVVHAVVRTPAAHLTSALVHPQAGAPVRVHFSAPVQVVSVRVADAEPRFLHLDQPRRVVSIGLAAVGDTAAGTALVAGAPRRWERLPSPVRVSWFSAGPAPKVLVRPAPLTRLAPSAPIVLTFSRPVAEVLGAARPALIPRTSGAWHEPNPNTLVFQPSGLGFPLARRVHLRLPRAVQVISGADPDDLRTVSWQVPRGSVLRMEQLLAELGYLPLRWRPTGPPVVLTPTAQVGAAVEPPPGRFAWRYAKTPEALKGIWSSDELRPVLVRGAIMAFESSHGLTADGYPTMALLRALIRAELAGRRAGGGYTYVYVSETLPQTLTLWHNGRIVLRTPVNTGISSRPTALGTYPVYLHLSETTMQGTNPDGTPYDDPGVPWVNYFNGGDAVHGFIRGSYGWPQSLGCVEVPIPTAAQIFPYVQVGTLVTVTA